jgi:tetratricopeptide (TPR) repeat protein
VKYTAILLLCLLPALAQRDTLRDAVAAYDAGDVNTAIRLYREFLKEYSDAAEIRSNLAAALVRAGRFAEAIQEYKTALEALPNNARVRLNLALAYYKLGRIPEAIGELRTLHQLQPFDSQPALLLAECLLQAGQADQAIALLTDLERENPEDRAAAYLLGVAYLRQNETARARQFLDRILKGGESAESAYLLGHSAYLGQDKVAAAGYLERAIQLNPDLPGVHSLYGMVLKEIGKPEAAPEQFREELKRNPFDFTANIETAMLLKQERKLPDALAHVERALQVRPADPGARYQRASIHSLQGLTGQAAREFEQLVKDEPNFAEAHAALAAAYYRLKRKADGDRARATAARVQQENQRRLEEKRKRAGATVPSP